MEKFFNMIAGRALTATGNTASSGDIGKITSYDPINHLVIVQIHPETEDEPALQTGWIPFGTAWAGNGWGMYAAPALNTLCTVLYQQGSRQQAIGATPLFDAENRPLNVDSGEFWIVHKSGSYLKFTNDGKVLMSSESQIDISAPTVNINASTQCNIFSPDVSIGDSGGAFETLLKSDNSPTTSLKGN